MTNQNKKILFISSYAPPSMAGAPQVMYKLLHNLPSESYSILTSFYNIDKTSTKLGSWLDCEYFFYDRPNATKLTHQQETSSDSQANPNHNWLSKLSSAIVNSNITTRLKLAAKKNKWAKAILGDPATITQIFLLIKSGKKIVRSRNVELLVGFSDYGPALIATYHIHKATNIPFIVYFFDIYKGNMLPALGKLLANVYEKKLCMGAEKIIVNNEGTKEFYRQRYGDVVAQKIEIIYNATDPTPYLALQTPYQPKPPYKILFTGNIYWAQLGSMRNLVKAIDQLPDLNIELHIYATQSRDYLKSVGLDRPYIQLSVAPPTEIPKIQSQADILFLPLSWHTESPDIINTATPGKLTEFLITGRPILIHAPAESYLVKYARENDFAMVVDKENIDQLADNISKLLLDTNWSNQLIQNAQATFQCNHDLVKNTESLRILLYK